MATLTLLSSSPLLLPSPLRRRNLHSSLRTAASLPKPPKNDRSWVSPDWLTSLTRSLSPPDESNIPIANAKLDDVSDLLGGALFLPLYKWMVENGPVYRLAAGPRNFVVVSDPAVAKHVLRNYGSIYAKGLVSEVSEFLFGSGFATAEGSLWMVRRKAVLPSLHKKFLSVMVDKVFNKCAERLVEKLEPYLLNGEAVNMEAKFSQLTLDVIGLSLFNYDFDSLASDSPVIEAVYTALKETELRATDILPYWKAMNMEAKFSQLTLDAIGLSLFNYDFDSLASDSPVIEAVYIALKEAELRATDILPYWKAKFSQLTLDLIGLSLFNYDFDSLDSDSPVIDAVYTALKDTELRATDILPYWKIGFLCKIIPRQIKAERAVRIIREQVEDLIAKCKKMVEAENEQIEGEEYINETDPSILRFLLASRDEVSSVQLRDDLLSMLVAGHETTGSVLTWTIYLLSKDPKSLEKAQEEVDRVLQGRLPKYEDIKNLKFLMRCLNESMRLYPHPPVLIRRAIVDDVLPGNYKIKAGQDIMISVYNIHHSNQVWDRADKFVPDRFELEGPIPNESNTDFRFIPFSGGPRKCVGDQFALLEAIVAFAVVLQKLEFELVADQKINMTTGATIHTTNGLYMKLSARKVHQEPALALS